MDRKIRWGMRRAAVLFVGVVLAAVMVAPAAALASGNTIHAAPGMQFSGVVDGSPTCQPTSATIDWGDDTPTSPGTIDPNNHVISGTHTYATSNVPNQPTVTLACPGVRQVDDFTARVDLAQPQFTQCPPVDHNSGCQFLIVASAGGSTIQQDTNQPAYDDGADDALIGIQNNTSAPISSIPLAGTPGLFGFESDGLCDPSLGGPGSSPIPSGCHPTGQPSTTCNPDVQDCAFPAPPGQPAGYTEPGNLSGNTQNGYEGPTTWFSNVSADTSSGQINFSPAIPPGQSTYFSLEEPPSASSLNASSKPNGVTTEPPTVSATGASFSALVDPNGSPTTVTFRYGLDNRYGRGTLGPHSLSTPVQSIGGDFSSHFVSATVGNLVPNAVYHVWVEATNKNGTTIGTDMVFTTKRSAPPKAPTLGKTFNISPAGGLVLIKVKGHFIPLTQARQFHTGTEIDALNGRLQLVTATARKHKTQHGLFFGGIFRITQLRSGADRGLAVLTIVEGAFKGAPTYARCPKKAADRTATAAALSRRVLQTLRGNARGRFRTVGRFAAATVRGTDWGTVDRCDGTLTRVRRGTVLVTDFVHHRSLLVHAGHTYLASRK